MSYYGSGYMQGVGGQMNPIQPNVYGTQGQYNYPTPSLVSGFNALPSGPTPDSQISSGPSAADAINGNPLTNILKPQGYGAGVNPQTAQSGEPAWVSQYINDQAGKGADAGQMNDAFYNYAPTISNIGKQYGSAFDPSAFGIGNGSLSALQSTLGAQGYGLDNIGGYYQNQSQNGPVSGVNYQWDPNFGVTGSIGGLNFDVKGLPSAGSYIPNTNPWSQYFPNGGGPSGSQIQNAIAAGNETPWVNAGSGVVNNVSPVSPMLSGRGQVAGANGALPQGSQPIFGNAINAPTNTGGSHGLGTSF